MLVTYAHDFERMLVILRTRSLPEFACDLWVDFEGLLGDDRTDNSLSKSVLGLEYMDMGETFKDSVSSMVDGGFVPAKPAAKL